MTEADLEGVDNGRRQRNDAALSARKSSFDQKAEVDTRVDEIRRLEPQGALGNGCYSCRSDSRP